jgi:hypothetical protein
VGRAPTAFRAVRVLCVVLVSLSLGAAGADAATWTTGSVPVPKLPFGVMSSVSCSSASWCMAVGSVPDTAYSGAVQRPLVELWNGAQWQAETVPEPAGARQAGLAAVSCVSTQACVAVGSFTNKRRAHRTLVEVWNGTAWTVSAAPRGSGLLGVSCASVSRCAAVGGQTLARWNGIRWSSRLASAGSAFVAVSCTSTSLCVAVGARSIRRRRRVAGSAPKRTLVASTVGARWRIWRTPNPVAQSFGRLTSNFDALSGVSCVSASSCMAVGYASSECGGLNCGSEGDDAILGLALSWNGRRWRTVPTPALATPWGAAGVATAISCVSSDWCLAIGGYVAGAVWNGSAWASVASFPNQYNLTGLLTGLSAVSCASRSACEVVGSTATGGAEGSTATGGVDVTAAGHLEGTALVSDPTSTALDRPVRATLNAVSCADASDCMAVGSYELGPTAPSQQASLAEYWNGSSWTFEIIPPVPAQVNQGLAGWQLNAVDCTMSGSPGTPATCIAVGPCLPTSCPIEQWDGTDWVTVAAPLPASTQAASGFLSAVSCASINSCTAVGTYGTHASSTLPLVEHWDGQQWALQNAPTPSITYNGGGGLGAVSCPATTFCMATGPGDAETELWNGRSWTPERFPPGDDVQGQDDALAVSCVTTAACLTVGDGSAGQYNPVPWASTWNGTGWTPASPPSSSPPFGGRLVYQITAVSCASQTACLAVGKPMGSGLAESRAGSLAGFWNGTGWTNVALPRTAGTVSIVHGISCPSSNTCIAVGNLATLVKGVQVAEGPFVWRYAY